MKNTKTKRLRGVPKFAQILTGAQAPAITAAHVASVRELDRLRMSFNNVRAIREGWGLFNGNEIQRDDESAKFRSDAEALAYVKRRAAKGSAYHRSALALCVQPAAGEAAFRFVPSVNGFIHVCEVRTATGLRLFAAYGDTAQEARENAEKRNRACNSHAALLALAELAKAKFEAKPMRYITPADAYELHAAAVAALKSATV